MGLDRAFQFSSLLLAAIAFSGLAMTADLPAGFQFLGLAALLLRMGLLLQGTTSGLQPSSSLSTHFWNVVIVLAFAWFWIDFLWFAQDLLGAGVHFLIALMVNKLYNLQHRRDYLQLYAISLMMVLASAGMTADLWYGTIVVAYLLAGVWTLLLYQLYMESRQISTGAPASPEETGTAVRRIDASFFWTTNAFALLAFGLTLVIFFSIPRIGTGFFKKGHAEGLRTAGFSEKVDLGAIGAIKLDDSVVMRVEFPDGHAKPSEPLYLRGMAYDRYNGRAWVNTSRRRRLPNDPVTRMFHVPSAPTQHRSAPLVHDILLEPLDTTVLFGASMARSIEGDFQTLQVDAMGAVYLPYSANGRTQYRVWSSTLPLAGQDKPPAPASYPEAIRRHFLQLPPLNPEVTRFAQTLTRHATRTHEKVLAITTTLQSQYRYSLDVGRSTSGQPLDDFLFTRKTGYCEHYATALVVLLRTVGVPARLVTGFMPSEWNEYGNYYTVRQRDAHAWVEVYDDSTGWVTVDPTPSVAGLPSRGFWTGWSNRLDSLRLQWDRLIVQYSVTDQLAVVQTVRESTDSLRARLAETWNAATDPWLIRASTVMSLLQRSNTYGLLALLGLLLIGWGISRLGKMIRRRLRSTPTAKHRQEELAAQQLYGKALKILSTKGFIKSPALTPQEFLHSVGGTWQEAAQVLQPLTELYYAVRFGNEPFSPRDLQHADELLARLRATPHSSTNTLGIT